MKIDILILILFKFHTTGFVVVLVIIHTRINVESYKYEKMQYIPLAMVARGCQHSYMRIMAW